MTLLVLGLPFFCQAQTQLLTTPLASPKAMVAQRIGLTDAKIVYFRPAAKDRDIWKDLAPAGQVWRAGANDNTVVHFSTNVQVEGKELAAGTYGLHIIPGEERSTIIFSNNSTSWGSFSYDPKEDALRVDVDNTRTPHFYEFLTYEFIPESNHTARCVLNWGDRSIGFRYAVDLEETVLADIRKELRNRAAWSWQGWNEAANYCLQNNMNHEEALQWAARSVFIQPTPQNLITKARLTGIVKAEKAGESNVTAMMETLENDLKTQPTTWKEWSAAANFAQKQGQTDKALEWAATSVGMSPQMTNMMAQAQLLEEKGEAKHAAKLKTEAIEKGTNAELNTYGYQLLFAGKTKEAIEIFVANTKKYPEDPNVWDSLGEAYTNAGEKEKAIQSLKKSLSLNPPPNVRANSLKLLKQLGVDTANL